MMVRGVGLCAPEQGAHVKRAQEVSRGHGGEIRTLGAVVLEV